MNNQEKNYKLPILIIAAVFLLAIVISIICVLNDNDDDPSKNTVSPAPTSSVFMPEEAEGTIDAIVASVNPDDCVITLCPLGNTEFVSFIYTGATDIRTSYDKPVTASMLRPGDFVSAAYNGEKLLKITGMPNVFAYRNASDYTIEADPMRITIGGEIYRYDNNLLVLNDEYFVSPTTLYETDILSFYSIDNFVYLIKVATGHGYLNLSNYEEFIGGTLQIGNSAMTAITENMRLTLREGIYNIIADNGTLSGSATVNILRDKTAVFDLASFLPEPVEYGSMIFAVEPQTAKLYIDGILKEHTSAVSLSYGEHYVDVLLDGYTPYDGIVTVNRSNSVMSIALTPAPDAFMPDGDSDLMLDEDAYSDNSGIPGSTEDVSDDTSDNAPDDISDDYYIPDSTSDDGSVPEVSDDNIPESDSEPELIIHCTEGAAVYIDDIYKGVITDGTLRTGKICGTVSIRLTREGYISKNYTVTVDDDGEDAEFTFPEMVKE